jgi:DNA (cytosine-5)-methyltransferase 1
VVRLVEARVMTAVRAQYSVPTMAEIAGRTPDQGPAVISLFAGAGGSCLGFKMAGFRTLAASEFVPAARETYGSNFPRVPILAEDIRELTSDRLLAAAGVDVGEADVLEASPPCCTFSASGRRQATWGKVKRYSDTKQRVDDLFFEFARILAGVQPRVFVAENVPALAQGASWGYFKEILAALRGCGYVVEPYVLALCGWAFRRIGAD